MDLIMKLNIVNKHEYEEQEDYREIILKIPNQMEMMERDFRYLGLDYNNLSIQDTHILNCEVIDKTDPSFSGAISTEISNIISRAKDLGYTTPFQDIKKLFTIINTFNSKDKDKLLAILECKEREISKMKDVIKFANNINCFELLEAYNEEDLARKLIYNNEIDIEDLMEYSDLQKLGRDISIEQKILMTEQGYLRQNEELKQEKIKEEEEEFE